MPPGIEYRYSERGPEPEPVSDNVPEPVFVGPPIPLHIINQRQFRIITESRDRMDKAKSIALDKALAAMDALFNKRGPTMDNSNQKTQIADAIVTKFEPAAPGIYPGIPGEAYHGGPGLSKSGLDWALVSGQHYHYYQVEGNDQKLTAALREGRILHKVVLEFEDFNSEFVVEPEWPEDAVSGAEQLKAIIQSYNENLEQKPAIEELIQAIESHNAKLPKPIDAGKSVGEHEAAYELLPEAFQTLGEDDKRTATALKACIKAHNDSLPKPIKASGSYQAVLENYTLLGIQQAERAAHIHALPTPLPLSGTKAEMAERIRTFNSNAVFLEELKEQFMQEAGGREVLTANEYQHALRYREAVLAHPEAAVLLDEGVRNDLLGDCQPRSVKTYLGHVGNLLQWAARNELIEREFDVRVHAAKLSAGKSADPFEHWEFQKLLEVTSNKQFKNILLVLAYTGIRPGELRALSWEDVDMEQRVIHIRRNITQQKMQFKLPKTNRTRIVHLMPPALVALEEQFKITGALSDAKIDMHLPGGMIVRQTLRPVFRPTRLVPGRPPFYSAVFLVAPWQAAIKKSGVRYRRAYQLRHTFASWNITAHGNLAFIAEQMGHNSARMLQEVYGKWIESASRSEADLIWSAMQKNGHLPQ